MPSLCRAARQPAEPHRDEPSLFWSPGRHGSGNAQPVEQPFAQGARAPRAVGRPAEASSLEILRDRLRCLHQVAQDASIPPFVWSTADVVVDPAERGWKPVAGVRLFPWRGKSADPAGLGVQFRYLKLHLVRRMVVARLGVTVGS